MTAVVSARGQHRHHVRLALASSGFRRLTSVRLLAQFGDGVFQASLAGAVLFNPEHAAHAGDVATGFAVLLLPYSVIGPFAGVLLDRWWRQRVLVWANLLRAIAVVLVALEIAGGLHGQPFYASALVVLSLSRFFLSGLSASQPHVVGREELVTANALTTTLGSIATTAGGGAAIGVRALIGSGNSAYASVGAAAAVPYLASAIVAAGFARTVLGPDEVERGNRETLAEVAHGLAAGARHLRSRQLAWLGLTMITLHRISYGLFAVCTVLLFRNYYRPDGVFRSGIAGLGQVVTALAVGGAIAALVTPPITRRLGFVGWATTLLVAAGIAAATLGSAYVIPAHLVAALLIAFCAQGIKISVDTLLQRSVADEFRGRAFAFYDTLFNLALVAAAVLTAVALPDNGHSPASAVAIGVSYLVIAAGFAAAARRGSPRSPTTT